MTNNSETKTGKQIAIVTWYLSDNYGTCLQAYALQAALRAHGYDARMLEPFKQWAPSRRRRLENLVRPAYNVLRHRGPDGMQLYKPAVRKFAAEDLKYFRVTDKASFERLLTDVDAFVTGSDQIWNPNYLKPFYLLDFAGDARRIAYASSIGVDMLPESAKPTYKHLLAKFSAIGVRESQAVELIGDLLPNKPVKHVVDPTFLLSPDQWKTFGDGSSSLQIPHEPYLFVYLVGKRPEYVVQVQDVSQRYGLSKIVVVPSAENPDLGIPGSSIYHGAGPREFVHLLANASAVCTDSFHATAISINLGKDFVEFLRFNPTDSASQNSRVVGLLNDYNLQSRFYTSTGATWSQPIEYISVHQRLSADIAKSESFLLGAIEASVSATEPPACHTTENHLQTVHKNCTHGDADDKQPSDRLKDCAAPTSASVSWDEQPFEICLHDKCTGCNACGNACPAGAIRMTEDPWGESHPFIDRGTCIECKKCVRVCPANNPPVYFEPKQCEAAWIDNIADRRVCASGGIATAISRYVINSLNGAVFGTAWDSNLAPVTISVSDELGIERLKGSKYVQSRISTDTYKDVESKLRAGTFVAFIGTPCQIAGLLSYLGKSRYENLLTIDLVCHGTSPASYLQAEVEDLIGKHKLGHVDNIRFRGNDRNNYCLTLWDRNEGKAKRLYKDYENCYIVGFLGGITLRENCYSCPYARPERISDITIGDFIGLGSTIPFPYSTKNTSCVLLNTERGLHFYEQLLTSSKDLRSYTRQYSERLAYGPSLRYPFQRSQLNARFRELYTTEGWILASRKVILPEALRRKSARLASYSWRVPRKIWKIAKSTAGKVTKSGTQG